MNNIRINSERLWASLMEMAQIGATAAGGSCRLALTEEDRAGRDLFKRWCEEAGCTVAVDQVGNMYATRPGHGTTDADAAPVATGSHLDTQPTGGKFDGVFGVLAGLEVIRTLNDHGIRTEAPIEVINWTNEEGSRFAPAMLASGVFAGLFEKSYAFERTDEQGIRFDEALREIGYAGDMEPGARKFRALFEAHIEQGPILERHADTIGVVTGGQGQRWYDACVIGRDSHTGTTPMDARRDALAAAAVLVQNIEEIAKSHAPGVATVGTLNVSPNSRNTIPGRVDLTIDVRHPQDAQLSSMAAAVATAIDAITSQRGVEIELTEIWYCPPTPFDPDCIGAVRSAAQTLGLAHRDMVSGAGHDAIQVASVAPAAMIFVPCEDGLSHNEAESATPSDLAAGCNVLLHAMLERAGVVSD